MLTARFLRDSVISFVVIFASDYLWHTMLFPDFYTAKMGALVTAAGGSPNAPIMTSIILLEVLLALGVAWFVPKASSGKVEYVGNGLLLGLLCGGSINLLNHSFFPPWDITLVLVDTFWAMVTFAVAAGVITIGKKA